MNPTYEYDKIRDEIKTEYNLLNSRLTWFVTSQSFLVSAFAISRANGFVWFDWFATLLLPIVGLLLAALVLPSLMAACQTIELWHEKQAHFFVNQPEFDHCLHLNRKSWLEHQGLLLPQIMPFVFITFWLVIHVASYFW